MSSCGFRGECNWAGEAVMIEEVNKLMDKRHHYPFVFLVGNSIPLEVGEAGEMEGGPVSLKYVLPPEAGF